MLGTHDAIATVAVRDLEAARTFDQDALGLEPIDRQGDEVIVFRSGATKLNVYRSQLAGTNRATVVNWAVDDVRAAVRPSTASPARYELADA